MPTKPPPHPIASALRETLQSPNEADSNGEIANVVDGLFAIARSIESLAQAIEMATHVASAALNKPGAKP